MDFQGPLYDVRMSRGQGYNSYIQEPRLYKAVEIEALEESKLAAPKDVTDEKKSAEVNKPVKQSTSSTTPDLNDLVPAILEYVSKNNNPASKGDAPVKQHPYLKPQPSGRVNQTVLFSSKQVKDKDEISQAMGFKASAAVKAASVGPGAELGANLATKQDFTSDSVNFLVHVKVVNEKPDRREKWTFAEVVGLKDRLLKIGCRECRPSQSNTNDMDDSAERDGNVSVSTKVDGAEKSTAHTKPPTSSRCACDHKRAIEFTRMYGDTFISDFVEGGEIYALISIKSGSKAKLNELKAYASAQLTPAAIPVQVHAETEFETKAKSAWEQAETSIRVQYRGGGEIKTHDFQWGLDNLIDIANAFPSFVAATSAKIRAVLTPYSALESFQAFQNQFPEESLTLNYERCALFVDTLWEDYNSFHSMWAEISDIINSPDGYVRKKGTRTGRAGQPPEQNQEEIDTQDPSEVINSTPLIQVSDVDSAAAVNALADSMAQHPVQVEAPNRRLKPQSIYKPPVQSNSRLASPIVNNTPQSQHGNNKLGGRETPETEDLDECGSETGLSQTGPTVTPLTNLRNILKVSKLVPLAPNETHQLSKLRLVCRLAMLHIQDLAAELVLDPQKSEAGSGKGLAEFPVFVQPLYPYPGIVKALLPLKKAARRGAAEFGEWHYKSVEDLRFPDSIKLPYGSKYPDDYLYWWDVYGDALSDYKKYEYFQIGNFDPNNEAFPQAVAFQRIASSVIGYVDKKTRDDTNMISGIAFRYNDPPSISYNDMENTVLNDGKPPKTPSQMSAQNGLLYTICAGKPPANDQWVTIPEAVDSAPINRVNMYYKQGSGRISGLELYCDPANQFDFDNPGTPLISHQEWEGKPARKSAPPTSYPAIPGDGFTSVKLWMFAGFVGAFEKVGPFRKERALAKIAVIWKRKASEIAEDDGI